MSNNNSNTPSENSNKQSEEGSASSKSGAKSKRKRANNASSASQSATQESPEVDSSENKEWRFHTLSYNNSNASLSTEQRRSCSFYGTEVPLVKWKFSNVGNSFTSTNAAPGETMDFPNFTAPQPVQQTQQSPQINQSQTNASPMPSFFHDFVLEDPSPTASHKKRKIPITVAPNTSSNLPNTTNSSAHPIVPPQVPTSSLVPQAPQQFFQQQHQTQVIAPLQVNTFLTANIIDAQSATPTSSSSNTSNMSPLTPTTSSYRIDPSQMLQASTETWMQLINELIAANSRLQFENNQLKAQNSDLIRRLQEKSEQK